MCTLSRGWLCLCALSICELGCGRVQFETVSLDSGAPSDSATNDRAMGDAIGMTDADLVATSDAPTDGSTAFCSQIASISLVECEALVDLYRSTNGEQWTARDGWLDSVDPCNWYGVTCSSSGSAIVVRELNLRQNSLSGFVPDSIADLRSLQILRLDFNSLGGSIPASIGELTGLRTLRFSNNSLTGPIPPELGNLTQLTGALYLYSNQLSGPIPPELGNLSNLRRFLAFDNQLSGSIPVELGNMTNLQTLSLHDNALAGEVPTSLMTLPDLTSLSLSGQTGCFTAETAQMSAWLDDLTPGWNDGC